MREFDLSDLRQGASETIRYDAEKVAEFIADMEACMSSYNTKASALETEYSRYYNNHTYVGKAAEASKEFINRGQLGRLHEGHLFLLDKLYKRYINIAGAFEDMVDASPKARIDTDELREIKKDHRAYANVVDEEGHNIESRGQSIKDRFERFLLDGEVTVPNYYPERNLYEELSGTGGQLDDCIKRCIEFDDCALDDINRSDLEEQLYDLTEDITNTANILDGFQVYSPDVGKTTVSLLALNNAKAITAFNALNPNRDNNAEVVQLAKLLNIKCSLNTVVDTDTINTAAELTLLNCKTDQDRIAVQQCAAMVGASADVITIEQILQMIVTMAGEGIAAIASAAPPIAVVVLILAMLGIAAYGISHAISADKKDDANIKERAKEALEGLNNKSEEGNEATQEGKTLPQEEKAEAYEDLEWYENESNPDAKGRQKNNIRPNKNTDEPHVVYKKDPETGEITNYKVYKPNPQNPSGFDEEVGYDAAGKGHINKETGEQLMPHVHDKSIPGGVREPNIDEIPR